MNVEMQLAEAKLEIAIKHLEHAALALSLSVLDWVERFVDKHIKEVLDEIS